jgi:hypothetical protein
MKDLLYQLSYITILKYTIPLSLDSESNEQYAKTDNG